VGGKRVGCVTEEKTVSPADSLDVKLRVIIDGATQGVTPLGARPRSRYCFLFAPSRATRRHTLRPFPCDYWIPRVEMSAFWILYS
jgi:hypothetical protein